ncbi:hypothetical protein [Uliginosibacterium sp. 31-12]|uniref:hypothetical protein n=1 Tax=Uliginosibacterium sp. 31-12 TaxID=3062781 RepID=UPI0026E478BC|nr:hypothetical protein [Uliginosibacterium sp. 31-12]MDO6388475.1 hypothetical protein [Uliginosibacterium sp. 31-12]
MSQAFACSCVTRTDVQQFKEAKTVVVGLVREARYVEDPKVFGGGYVRVAVEVTETLKGKKQKRIEVIDQVPEAGMCSSFLRPGVEFVLFIDNSGEAGMCSGTRTLGATTYDRPQKIQELWQLKARAEK